MDREHLPVRVYFRLIVGAELFSRRPGFIYYVEGNAAVISYSGSESSAKGLRSLRAGQNLRTEAGRVEVMLAPGLILRAAEKTEIKMVKAHPRDLQLRLISGSAALQVVRKSHLDSLLIHSGDSTVKFRRLGLYRLDAPAGESPQLRVFDGQAVVFTYGVEHNVKKKWSLAFAEPDNRPLLARFDPTQKDSFDQWHRERTTVLEAAQRKYLLSTSGKPIGRGIRSLAGIVSGARGGTYVGIGGGGGIPRSPGDEGPQTTQNFPRNPQNPTPSSGK